jgi:hypothetical protein
MNLRTNEEYLFLPPRRRGGLILLGLIFLLAGSAALGLYQASRAQIGPVFLLSLLPILAAIVLIPWLGYQLYCLWTAQYSLERDGLRIRWGLRLLQIPMSAVQWVHGQAELTRPLPRPVFRLPGAVVGVRHLPPAERLEYLASESAGLVYVCVGEQIYGLSPRDPAGFLYTFQRLMELGSLTPLQPRSDYPSFLVARVWANRPARWMLVVSLVLSLALFAWVGLAIPGQAEFHLGFHPDGSPGDLAPAVQLFLLPVLNWMIVLFDFFLGLFFFRREDTHYLSYLLWFNSALVPALFLVGLFFILQAG